MTGELTACCNRYYELTQLLSKREERFKNLLDNAPLYFGQTGLSEVDALINYYRKVQAAKAKIKKTLADMKKTARTILMIMQHFEIPPGTVLTGEIPGELAYELWADEDDEVFINKIKNLEPETDDLNIIVIKLWSADNRDEEK